jgi:N-methylhydantoinase B/oxoprolinase/acetone carboxylase alpha subunit
VTYSAVIYALRCMVADDIPLNQGCLAPITFAIPPGCLLRPSPGAAVVGGNVLTSQRVTDVVLRAFGAAAASQGCMNNTTFGDEGLGYYETVAGGAGAGPGWHGRRCGCMRACVPCTARTPIRAWRCVMDAHVLSRAFAMRSLCVAAACTRT